MQVFERVVVAECFDVLLEVTAVGDPVGFAVWCCCWCCGHCVVCCGQDTVGDECAHVVNGVLRLVGGPAFEWRHSGEQIDRSVEVQWPVGPVGVEFGQRRGRQTRLLIADDGGADGKVVGADQTGLQDSKVGDEVGVSGEGEVDGRAGLGASGTLVEDGVEAVQ